MNTGIELASSDRVGFLLSDDWLLPTAVERTLRCGADLVSTGLFGFAADGLTELPGVHCDLSRPVYDRLPTLERKANYLSHFFLIRKTKIVEAGGLDESLGDTPGIDDYDLIWTLLERGAVVGIVEDRLYCYRDHCGERLTLHPSEEQCRTLARILEKHGVTGRLRDSLIRSHSRWFGRPIHAVQHCGAPVKVS